MKRTKKINLVSLEEETNKHIEEALIIERRSVLDKQILSLEEATSRFKQLYESNLKGDNLKTKTILSSLYEQSIVKKSDVISLVDKYKNTSFHVGAVTLLLDDALGINVTTNDIVQLSSENKIIDKELKILQEQIDVDAIIRNIGEDLISYGEYILSVETDKKKGVIAVRDDVNQGETIAVYDQEVPESYLRKNLKLNIGKADQVEVDKYIHFCIGSRKIRIKLEDRTISEYVRIGRPLFWGNFELLGSLNLMNVLVPVSYLHKINSTSIIGITVSDNTEPEKALEICKTYEGILNKSIAVDTTGNVTIADVINAAGRFKVVPIFGGDRGALRNVDPRYEVMTDTSVPEDMKRNICSSIGIPYEFLFGGGEKNRGETLKTFSRYVRRLLGIQLAIQYALQQLALIHLQIVKKDFTPSVSQIQVKFTNALVNVEELDKIEFLDTLISTIGNAVEKVKIIAQQLHAKVDSKILGKFIGRYLRAIDLEGLFEIPDDIMSAPKEEIPEGEENNFNTE